MVRLTSIPECTKTRGCGTDDKCEIYVFKAGKLIQGFCCRVKYAGCNSERKGSKRPERRGCLAESTKEQKESHSTRDRVCTHTIVQAGSPEAKKSDKLILGNRTFYIIDLDEVGSLGISTIYYAEERKDVK